MQQGIPQSLPPLPGLHHKKQIRLNRGTGGVCPEISDRRSRVDHSRGDRLARERNQCPEGFSVEPGKGKSDAAGLPEGDDAAPVKIEKLI